MLLEVGNIFLVVSISPFEPFDPYLDREDECASDIADEDDWRMYLLTPLELAPAFSDEDLEVEDSNLEAVSLEMALSLEELLSLRDEYGL